jgi:hypothetical protein
MDLLFTASLLALFWHYEWCTGVVFAPYALFYQVKTAPSNANWRHLISQSM